MGNNKLNNILKVDYNPKRIIGLDLLRVIAIFMVMLLHGKQILPPTISKVASYFYMDGVTIFFVLSGFLIGGIFIRDFEKKESETSNIKFFINFITRRWFRTLPNYYFVLTLLVLYFTIKQYDLSTIKLIDYYLFIQNFAWNHPPFFPEAWSLAVEEWFYLLIPSFTLIVFHLRGERSFKSTLIWVTFFVILFVIAFRFYRYLNFADNTDFDLSFRKQVILRFDSLMLGILASIFHHYYIKSWKALKNKFAIIGILFLAIYYFSSHIYSLGIFYDVNISFLIEGLSIFFLLPYFYYLKINNSIINKIIVHNSIISYSVYLLNYSIVLNIIIYGIDWKVVYHFLDNFTSYSHVLVWIIKYILFWSITIFLSTLNYNYFELYFIKLTRSAFR